MDESREEVTEYAQRMAGGGMSVRNPHPEIERVYPLAQWIPDHQRFGGKVYRRRVIVVEDWTEVPSGAREEEPGSARDRRLTSADPEPPVGSVVRDDLGRLWSRDEHSPACWTRDDSDDPDPESWTKVAGNYGPVALIRLT